MLFAAAGLTVTVGCWVIAPPPTVAETVLVSALVELSVPVATPFASVAAAGWIRVLPVVAAAARTTVFPLIGLPNWSFAVTVIVLALPPAVIPPGAATTVVSDGLTAPGTAKAVNWTGEATPVACAVCTLSVAVRRVPRVQLIDAIPLALVTELGAFTDPPPVSTDQLIVTPDTGLFSASRTTTEIGVGRVWPTVSVCRLPPLIAIWVAPPTCAVALNVTVVSPVADALVVCVPGAGPRVRVVLALPSEPVVDEVGFTEPPPDAGAQVIVTLGTGLLFASVTSTTCGVASVVPTCPVRLSPENFAIAVAAPTFAVSTNVTGLPASPVDVAVSVSGLACVPSVQLVTCAIPLAVVVWLAPVMEPLVVPGTANVTATPATGLLLTSRTITDGGVATAVPAVAVWLLPPFTATWVAVPAVTVTVFELTAVSVPAVKLSVRGPTVPVIVSPLNAATPLAFVRTAVVGESVPPPAAIAGVTETPAWATLFPAPSCSCTTGCCGNAIAFCTLLDGCVVSTSFAAGPALRAIATVVSGVRASKAICSR